ncbi:hypothetical protein KCU91_g5098, partial [Aureobasidium melanogenum]
MAILGRSIQDGEEYLEIDDASGCHTESTDRTTLVGFDDDDELVYDREGSCWKRFRKRLDEKLTWYERSHGDTRENLKCRCAVEDLMHTRCEIISEEKNILACKKCYHNWDRFKKRYLVNQPPEIKRKHCEWFVKHQKSGLRVGKFKWIEHDCQICGAEANRTPPPGYPDNNVKFCHKYYDAAKATKKTWSAWKISMLGKFEKLKFQGNCSIMLTNSGVGGLGLNLTVATRLINFDQYFNKAAEVHSKDVTPTPCSRQTTGCCYLAY